MRRHNLLGSTVAPKTGLGLNLVLISVFLFFLIPMFSAFLFSIQVGEIGRAHV